MALYESEVAKRDSIASQEGVDKNVLDRKISDVDTACNVIEDEIDVEPDGGWGWFVAFGAFVINLIVDGLVYTFGLFFIELYEYYDESKSLTAWVGSVALGILLFSGKIYINTPEYEPRRKPASGYPTYWPI